MKRLSYLVSGAMLVATTAFAQAPAAPPAPVGLALSLQRAYAGIKTNLTQAAAAYPDAEYNVYKPHPDNRTFGGQIGHTANAQFGSCAAARGVPNPNMGNDFEKKTTKAEFVKGLADSFAFCDDAFAALTDQSALELITQGRGQVARGGVLAGLITHSNEEYGVMTVYLRLKAVVPPSTANRGGGGGAAPAGGQGGRRGGQRN